MDPRHRFILILALFSLAVWTPVRAVVDLTLVQDTIASEVTLNWSGGAAPYQVFRSPDPSSVSDLVSLLSLSAASEFVDSSSIPPPGRVFFYLVREGECGDAIHDLDEQCDGGPLNSDTVPDACRTTCMLAACGDDVVDTGEWCDDGNTAEGDGCSQVCQSQPNVLLLIADDMGVENLEVYQTIVPALAALPPARMDTIGDLVNSGVTFWKAYSNPSCSPTRSGLFSGFHAFAHEITSPTDLISGCPTAESLQEALDSKLSGAPALAGVLPSAYSQGHFGKWHVGGQCDGDPYDSILELGWDYHDGSWEDIKDEAPNNDYCNWPNHVINGVLQVDAMGDEVPETTYATDYVVQEASGWIDTEKSSPWFATVAFNTPHTPIHDPATCGEATCSSTPHLCYTHMLEAMDDAIATLLDELATMGELSHTIVIFIGDNGTQEDPVYSTVSGPYPTGHYKGSVYEGGVNVPFIVADGCHYTADPTCQPVIVSPGRASAGLVHAADLFATIRALTKGTDDASTYGRHTESAAPYLAFPGLPSIRDYLYTQAASQCIVRNGRFKLIVRDCETTRSSCEMYDVLADPTETSDLLTGVLTPVQANALAELKTEITSLRSWSSSPSCP